MGNMPVQSHQEKYNSIRFDAGGKWMNDPNGLIKIGSKYHMFYQNNSESHVWGNISWGHAISDDLINWIVLEPAIMCTPGTMIFSGSAVLDTENVSGLGTADNPPTIAFYTACDYSIERDEFVVHKQSQCIAYSLDNGITWQEYQHNPIIDINKTDFRDPKVFYHHQTDRWIMIVALSKEHSVRIYSSKNLLEWRHESDFSEVGSKAGNWECPELFALENGGEEYWVLHIGIDTGAPKSGSGSFYVIGKFDGKRVVADVAAMGGNEFLWLDKAQDFFAAQAFSNMPKDYGVIWVGWLNNWNYAKEIAEANLPSLQSIPRQLSLVKTKQAVRLCQYPVDTALAAFTNEQRHYFQSSLTTGCAHKVFSHCRLPFLCEITAEQLQNENIELSLTSEHMSYASVLLSMSARTLTVIRARDQQGLNNFNTTFKTDLEMVGEGFQFLLIADNYGFELFYNNGIEVFSCRNFVPDEALSIQFSCMGSTANKPRFRISLKTHE